MVRPRTPLPTRGDGSSLPLSLHHNLKKNYEYLLQEVKQNEMLIRTYKAPSFCEINWSKNKNNRHPVTHEKRQLWPTAGVTLRHNSQFLLVTIPSLFWQALVKLLFHLEYGTSSEHPSFCCLFHTPAAQAPTLLYLMPLCTGKVMLYTTSISHSKKRTKWRSGIVHPLPSSSLATLKFCIMPGVSDPIKKLLCKVECQLPQTEEARAEAALLMGVQQNLIIPRNSEPLVAASQDFLTASYLITQRDVFYNRDEFFALVTCFGLAEEQVDIPTPAILKPVPLWTGKQLFSVMIRPNKDMNFFLSFEVKEKNYDSNLKLKHFCPNDG